jgi:hypothetical protein
MGRSVHTCSGWRARVDLIPPAGASVERAAADSGCGHAAGGSVGNAGTGTRQRHAVGKESPWTCPAARRSSPGLGTTPGRGTPSARGPARLAGGARRWPARGLLTGAGGAAAAGRWPTGVRQGRRPPHPPQQQLALEQRPVAGPLPEQVGRALAAADRHASSDLSRLRSPLAPWPGRPGGTAFRRCGDGTGRRGMAKRVVGDPGPVRSWGRRRLHGCGRRGGRRLRGRRDRGRGLGGGRRGRARGRVGYEGRVDAAGSGGPWDGHRAPGSGWCRCR